MTVLHSFSVLSSVTSRHVEEAVAGFQARCQPRDPGCRLLRDVVAYRSAWDPRPGFGGGRGGESPLLAPRPLPSPGLSLCELQPCDPTSTVCLPQEGLALCACRPGFRSAHPMDRACTGGGRGGQGGAGG